MRTMPLSLMTAALLALPMAAQQPTSPPPKAARPATTATHRDTLPVARLTEAQYDKLDAIRNRYGKEERAQREASRLRNEKMQAEIKGVLTPEQYARFEQRRRTSGGRELGMRGRRGPSGGGRRGGEGTMPMQGKNGMQGMQGMHGMQGMQGMQGTPGMGGQPGMMGRQGQMQGTQPAPLIPPTPVRPDSDR
jgi:Spy/CpxP family protein refolding chaperone